MKLKRVLIISYHTCPLAFEEGKETGGMNVYVYELAQNLGNLGIKVDVITRSQDKNNKKIVEVSKNFRVIHLIAGPQASIHKNTLITFIPQFVAELSKFISEEKLIYDVIHAHYYQSGVVALNIKQAALPSTPLVMTFHTLALMKNLVARSPAEFDSQDRIDAEFLLTKKANIIITPSESDKQYLHYLYEVPESKIIEIPPGVNADIFQPMSKSQAKKHIKVKGKEKIILFVGRIEPLKGIDVILYALKILRSENVAIRLLIVGGDVSQHITKWSPQLKQLEQLSRFLKISAFVDFVGQRPQHELLYYYNAAEIVVMPSHYESFGMAAAEAMACGTPVITTNVTGISNLIDELRSTQITTVNNPLLLASQINRLLTNQQLYEKIRTASIKNTRELCWDSIARKTLEVYRQLILKRKS